MQSGAFAFGPAEIFIIVVLGGGLLLAVAIFVAVLFFATTRSQASMTANLGEPIGQPTRLRLLDSSDKPVAESAQWNDNELHVRAGEASCKSLFDVSLNAIDQCMISYRFRIKTENLNSSVYPELWCRIPEKGQFFSRGLHQKVRGTHDWKQVEIPFYLQAGQKADLVHLNLVFEGPGQVILKDVEVLVTPLKK